jgi:hypothetical protein
MWLATKINVNYFSISMKYHTTDRFVKSVNGYRWSFQNRLGDEELWGQGLAQSEHEVGSMLYVKKINEKLEPYDSLHDLKVENH